MNLEQHFSSEKRSVARLLAGVFGPSSDSADRLGVKLERELADEIKFDHRDEGASEIQNAWSAAPPIAELVRAGSAGFPELSELQGLTDSTYAFRLLTLAYVLDELESAGGNKDGFHGLLASLGLGLREVQAYRDDFVR